MNISKFVHFESTELIVSSLGCVFKVLSVGISFLTETCHMHLCCTCLEISN